MKRPLCATILLWLVLSLTVLSGVRLATTIFWWSRLSPFTSLTTRIYLAISALFWLSLSLVIFWGLLKGARRSLVSVAGVAILFSGWYWADKLVLSIPSTSWYFALGVTVLLLICVILCVCNPRTKAFFLQREKNEE